MPELAEVFEIVGEGVAFSKLPDNTLFMIESIGGNCYWRTQHHAWSPYKSSLVFRKKDKGTVQRLMDSLPVPPERVTDVGVMCWPVNFAGT